MQKNWLLKWLLLVGVLFFVPNIHAQSCGVLSDDISASYPGYDYCEPGPTKRSAWTYKINGVGATFNSIFDATDAIRRTYEGTPNVCGVGPIGALSTGLSQGIFLDKGLYEFSQFGKFRVNFESPDHACGEFFLEHNFQIIAERTEECREGGLKAGSAGEVVCLYAAQVERPGMCAKNEFSEARMSGLVSPNPINLNTGEKMQVDWDFIDQQPHSLSLSKTYLSKPNQHNGVMGFGWKHSYETRLRAYLPNNKPDSSVSCSWPELGPPTIFCGEPEEIQRVSIEKSDGDAAIFVKIDDSWVSPNGAGRLVVSPNVFEFFPRENDDVYVFDGEGLLKIVKNRNGWNARYFYGNGNQLLQVQNNFGRSLHFSYLSSGLLERVTLPSGAAINYQYSSGMLVGTKNVDNSNVTYSYRSRGASQLLSQIEVNGTPYRSYEYDAQARAIQSELSGGVFKYKVSYNGPNTSLVDPLGTERVYGYSTSAGKTVVASSTAPSSSSEKDALTRSHVAGLINSEIDFRGSATFYNWDATRRLPLSSTQAVGQPESRTTSTTWHAQWRLPVTVTEPGRVTSYTYDSVGNALSQTVTDTATGGVARTTNWTYHPSGLVATETAANGAVTSYQYDSAGNLTSATNALSQVDTYTHDGAGRVLTHSAPNGLVVTYTYDARGRMLTANQGGLLTTLTYRPSGQVATASLPHGHVVSYTYDAAQRLTGWSDNRGNAGTYVLDAMGNRTREDLRNAQGQLVWRLARTINSLNRVESTTAGSQAATTYGYDANGDLISTTNGLGQLTQYGLDALRRVQGITNAEGASASLTHNALDSVTQASDFKGVATTYERDALGNARAEASPDAGTQSAQYDALGLPSSITDALGRATTIVRDSLGRPTSITHAGGAGGTSVASQTTTLRYDLPGSAYNQSGQPNASKGSLSEIVDASGTTSYQRDWHGRIVRKTQQLKNGHTSTVGYSYATSGLLAGITYPDGKVLQHQYDSTGQLTGMLWNNQPLVSGITWNPLGQPTGWTWNLQGSQGSSSLSVARSYNTAGQLTTTDFSSYQYDAAGRIQSLTQKLWRPASTSASATTVSQATSTWTVQYSPAGRITSFNRTTAANAAVDTASFEYDANGNRTASTRDVAGTSTSRTYTADPGHNRLLGFAQTRTAGSNTASTSVAYSYDAAGNQQGDGLHGYQYDSQGRLERVTLGTGAGASSVQYAHNALGLRVFKTDVLAGPSTTNTTSKAGQPRITLLGDEDEEQDQPGTTPPSAQGPGSLLQDAKNFWLRLWNPQTESTQAQGRAFVYAEDGSLLGEYPMEANPATAPTRGAQHIWLPTANGPMPIAVVGEGRQYAVHADHLNTPRRLTQEDGKVAWQWAYSAFGEEAPTTAATRFTSATTNPTTGSTAVPLVQYNLRYPGQYFDEESGLHYNHFRSYDSKSGRYTQFDPIGLAGGPNGFLYAGANPLSNIDPNGLDIVVITGGRREATNPFGHSALGVTGAGVFSYGNGTLLGSSVTSYVTSQSQYRNQQITIIPTTPEQDAGALKNLYGQGCKNCVGYFDNCAVRTNSALEAAGLRTGATGFPGSVARGAAGLPGAQTYTIPQDGPIPQSVIDALKQFTPTYVP